MILFATAYDEATSCNLGVAARLRTGDCVRITEEHASRNVLERVLRAYPEWDLLAMTHGNRRTLRAQGGILPHAIEQEDTKTLRGRKVFAWACQTGAELGPAAARAGVIWFGFPVKIAAPPENALLQGLLAGVLQRVVDRLPSVRCRSSCKILLDELVADANVVLETAELGDTQSLQCFEQFQLRLEAWWPGDSEPIRPTTAPKTRYDDLY
jgi:hypothetical protein